MIRTAALLIVLVLVGDAPFSAFCMAWCSPEAAAASGCHPADEMAVSHVAGDNDCDDASAGLAAMLPEDGRRDVAAPGVPDSDSLRLDAPRSTRLQISAGPLGQQVSLNRPRFTNLRI